MPEDPSQSLARAHILFSIALATCEVKQDVVALVPCSTDEALRVVTQVVELLGEDLEAATRVRPLRSH